MKHLWLALMFVVYSAAALLAYVNTGNTWFLMFSAFLVFFIVKDFVLWLRWRRRKRLADDIGKVIEDARDAAPRD